MDYVIELERLRKHEIQNLDVKNAEFPQFREVWLQQKDRDHIVGEAQRNGDVIYHWEEKEEEELE